MAHNALSNACIWLATPFCASSPDRSSVAPPAVEVGTPPSAATTVDRASASGALRSSRRAGPNAAATRRAEARVGGAERANRSKPAATVVRMSPRAASLMAPAAVHVVVAVPAPDRAEAGVGLPQARVYRGFDDVDHALTERCQARRRDPVAGERARGERIGTRKPAGRGEQYRLRICRLCGDIAVGVGDIGGELLPVLDLVDEWKWPQRASWTCVSFTVPSGGPMRAGAARVAPTNADRTLAPGDGSSLSAVQMPSGTGPVGSDDIGRSRPSRRARRPTTCGWTSVHGFHHPDPAVVW